MAFYLFLISQWLTLINVCKILPEQPVNRSQKGCLKVRLSQYLSKTAKCMLKQIYKLSVVQLCVQDLTGFDINSIAKQVTVLSKVLGWPLHQTGTRACVAVK